MIAIMNVFQVGVGLLLLSVTAATSLLEERVRGSLDLVLSTPLSTRSILAGKWLGTFRTVPLLLLAPALTTLCIAWDSGRWLAYFNYIGLLLAYSAVIVSLGLALATWLSRLERAVAVCVGVYVVFSIGWPAMIGPLAGNARDEHIILPLIMGSPLAGTVLSTLVVAEEQFGPPDGGAEIWIGCYLWMAIHGAIATFLYSLAVNTFDEFLGRMPETNFDVSRVHLSQIATSSPTRPRTTDWGPMPPIAPEPRRL